MPNVDIMIGRRSFKLVCGEGQEAHLQTLATEVSQRVDGLAESMGSSNDTLLLVMSALMMQDELNNSSSDNVQPAAPAPTITGISESENEANINHAVADAVDAIAQYVENVADRIQKG